MNNAFPITNPFIPSLSLQQPTPNSSANPNIISPACTYLMELFDQHTTQATAQKQSLEKSYANWQTEMARKKQLLTNAEIDVQTLSSHINSFRAKIEMLDNELQTLINSNSSSWHGLKETLSNDEIMCGENNQEVISLLQASITDLNTHVQKVERLNMTKSAVEAHHANALKSRKEKFEQVRGLIKELEALRNQNNPELENQAKQLAQNIAVFQCGFSFFQNLQNQAPQQPKKSCLKPASVLAHKRFLEESNSNVKQGSASSMIIDLTDEKTVQATPSNSKNAAKKAKVSNNNNTTIKSTDNHTHSNNKTTANSDPDIKRLLNDDEPLALAHLPDSPDPSKLQASPLHWHCSSANVTLEDFKKFLKHDLNLKEINKTVVGWAPIQLLIMQGDIEKILEFLKYRPKLDIRVNEWTLMQLIALNPLLSKPGIENVIAILLDNKCLLVEKLLLRPPAHIAAYHGNHLTLQAFRNAYQAFVQKDGEKRAGIKMGVFINQNDSRGYSPIHYAALTNNIECIQVILETTNRNINSGTDPQLWTPLMLAASVGNPRALQMLIAQRDIDLELRDKDKLTALGHAKDPLPTICVWRKEDKRRAEEIIKPLSGFMTDSDN